jgi:L-ascorbate metabolism protein UlaG (beta-lactamase superfamily)
MAFGAEGGSFMKITALGHSAFRIETGKAVILIDPFITGNPAAKPGIMELTRDCTHVLLTHGHDDHVGDTVEICKATGATLVSSFEVCNYLAHKGVAKYSPGNHGGRISFDDFDSIFTNAWHSSSHIKDGIPIYLGNPMGFVIEPKTEPGKTVYVMGDTGISHDMSLVQELYKPVIGIVPIGDRFTMGPDQAALACRKFFTFSTIIPCHYASFEGYVIPHEKPFLEAMGPDAKKVKPLKSGESIKL